MTPEETCNSISGFFEALNLAIRELDQEVKQTFLDRLAHYVKRVTREQPRIGTLTSSDAEYILRLHQLLLETVHRGDGQDVQRPPF